MANKRVLVDPPPFTALRFGLLSTAIDRTPEAPDHWRTGVTWQSHCPGGNGTYDPCLTVTRDPNDLLSTATPDDPPGKEPTSELAEGTEDGPFFLRGATPFTIFTRFDCNPVGFWDRAQELATQALIRVENFEVERIFDTGVAPRASGADETAYPHLRDNSALVDDTGAVLQTAAEVVTSNAVDIVEGIARIQAALAGCYHGRGVIHVPAVFGPALMAHNLTTRSGPTLETQLGNRISLGTGYSGAAPDGDVTPGIAWVYATGAVFLYRSEIRVNQLVDSFDRAINTVQMIAERTYVLGWDCCHLAIPVRVGGIPSGEFDTPALEPSV